MGRRQLFGWSGSGRVCVAVLLCMLVSPEGRSEDWTAFRGADGQGNAGAVALPLKWGLDENIAWKTELPGPGASSPVVHGERVYVTCYSGFYVPGQPGGTQADLRRHLLCLDRSGGRLLWQRAVEAKLPEEEQIRDHGFAASTPACDASGVVVFFGKTGVIAFDHSGKEQWRADVGSKTHGWGSSASPVLHGNLVLINASVESESLRALDRRTGREVWRVEGIRESWNTPVIGRSSEGREELLIAMQGSLRSYDPKTGELYWSCGTDITWYMVPSVVCNAGTVYCLGGRSGVAGLAVRMGGSGDVTESLRLWTSMKGSNVTSPVFHDGHLYFMNDNREIAYCLSAETGEVVYEERVNRAGQIYASALLAGGRIYYLSRDGRTIVVPASPEFSELGRNDLGDGGQFNGSFAVDGQRLLVRSDRYLYAIGQD
jgi:outer membrane protein assembly factor BamB